jgi:hypothetical protein
VTAVKVSAVAVTRTLSYDQLAAHLTNGTLIMSCNYAMYYPPRSQLPNAGKKTVSEPFSEPMERLLESGKMSDFRIVCGSKTWPCHKAILANQSDVLETMMSKETWAESRNRFHESLFSPKTFETNYCPTPGTK